VLVYQNRPLYEVDHATERVAAAGQAARALPFPFTMRPLRQGDL